MILVDSSKYISWMRRGLNPVSVLRDQLNSRSLVSCGIIRIEVLRGIIKPAPRHEMERLFEAIPEIALQPSLITQAAELAWSLDRAGRVLPLTDILIGACAKQVGATVISDDAHFESIRGLSLRRELNDG